MFATPHGKATLVSAQIPMGGIMAPSILPACSLAPTTAGTADGSVLEVRHL